MYTTILITVTMGEKRQKKEFRYELDNEICPEIKIPFTWKEACRDAGSVLELIDNAFQDPFDDMEGGLKATIAAFDDCVPSDYQSGKKYAKFQKDIQKGIHTIEDLKQITFQVLDTEEESTIAEKTLNFSE